MSILFGITFTSVYYLLGNIPSNDKAEMLVEKHGDAMGGKANWADLISYSKSLSRKNGLILKVMCRMPDNVSLHFQKCNP